LKLKRAEKLRIKTADRGFDSYEFKLGDLFRGERATLGLSLMDVQRELRINVKTILAIENCEISFDQDTVFISGYVKSYAKFLGLDPDWVFERFCEETNYKNTNRIENTRKRNFKEFTSKKKQEKKYLNSSFNSSFYKSSDFSGSFKIRSLFSLFSIFLILAIFGSGGMFVLNTIQKVSIIEDDAAPIIIDQVSYSNTNSEVFLNSEGTNNMEISEFVSRDGPIVEIDPNQAGIFTLGSKSVDLSNSFIETDDFKKENDIYIFASRPAWVRIYTSNGSIVNESILDVSEKMKVPTNINDLLVRSGNSGSVFIKIGNISYGPIGEGTSVVKDISLDHKNIVNTFEVVTDQKLLTPLHRLKIITEKTE